MEELLAHVTGATGVSTGQARGGVAVLVDLLRQKLDGGQWADLGKVLPQAGALAGEGAALGKPAGGGFGSLLGGLAGSMGGSVGMAAQVMTALGKLGLSREQGVQIAKAATQWLGPQLPAETRVVVEKLLSSITG